MPSSSGEGILSPQEKRNRRLHMNRMKLLALLVAAGSASTAIVSTGYGATIINIYTGGGSRSGVSAPGVTTSRPGYAPTAPAASPIYSSPVNTAPVASAPVVGALDGASLYNQYCSSCHGSGKKNSSASSIQSAINGNKGGMGSLKSLTSAQITAIAGGGSISGSTGRTKKND